MGSLQIVHAYKAAAAITNTYRVVIWDTSADEQVKVPTGAGDEPAGVTASVAANAGDSIDVVHFGLHFVTLGATLTRGATVQINSTGGKVKATTTNGFPVANILKGGVDGDVVPALVNCMAKSIQ